MRGETPICYVIIQTHMGWRAYSEKEIGEAFAFDGYLADGSVLADGSQLAGADSVGVLEKSARVLEFGSFERSLQPLKEDLLLAYQSKTLQHLSITLNNTDRYFSQLMAKEPFLGRTIQVYVGFETIPFSEHLNFFTGIITEVSPMARMTIEADEQ